MKKITRIFSILFIGLMLVLLTGCDSSSNGVKTSKSFTYNVETGDKVKLTLDTSDNYDLTSSLPFTISKDDEDLTKGIFLTEGTHEYYKNATKQGSNVKIIDSGSKDGIDYIFYNYKDTEFNYVIKIKDSNTGILLGNNVSEESAKECFNRLEIECEK
ncbi:MAG: hypothetical protein J6J36_04840 [Clostridia bacterium]|nr:hypothetical protein [Clostridia bacterium]